MFYENCSAITKDSDVPRELLDITNDRCFENRKCTVAPEGEDEGLFVGSGDGSQCTCQNLAVVLNRTSSQRYKRQTGEVFITSANVARVFRARKGARKLARDTQQLRRKKGNYIVIRQSFDDYTNSFEEEDFDLI